MNAKIRFWLSLYCFCVLTTDALAEETFHPSRMRFLVHGGYQLTEDLNLRIHFIPAGNLIGPVAPIIHPGLGIKLASWLEMEAVAGWCFATDNPLFSLRVTPTLGDFYAWLDGEYQYPSQNFYWFVQA
ncbi:MAG TPA: hypothetical protein VJB37_02770, partial [Patescibacteria group bacterium]|nr:hypothetical protein [Patescibacteria group bacterium]